MTGTAIESSARALRPARIREALSALVFAERDRWALWLPVAMGAGVSL